MSKRLNAKANNRKVYIIIFFTLIVIAAAIGLVVDNISEGKLDDSEETQIILENPSSPGNDETLPNSSAEEQAPPAPEPPELVLPSELEKQ